MCQYININIIKRKIFFDKFIEYLFCCILTYDNNNNNNNDDNISWLHFTIIYFANFKSD